MNRFVILLRGINVGGKNKIPMAALKTCLESIGCTNVSTYIQSGNAIVQTNLEAPALNATVESALPQHFSLDSSIVKVLAITKDELQAIVDNKPKGFGEQPGIYHSDVIFLMGIDSEQAIQVFSPRDGVDTIWPGNGVIYSRRLSAERTKSRLNKIVGTPLYRQMTIRNWNTVTKLLTML